MSSGVILFNKWVLASAKFNFRELLEFMISPRTSNTNRRSIVLDNMAHGVCNLYDPDAGSLYEHSGLAPQRSHDSAYLHVGRPWNEDIAHADSGITKQTGHCSNWSYVQFEFDLR